MKLQWLCWTICYSFATTLFSTMLNVLYFGWFVYLPFLTMSFLFPIITVGMIIHLSSGRASISFRCNETLYIYIEYTVIYFVMIFFIDLSISVFDDGYIHFGYLIGEVVGYLYGLYLTFINV